ncbi:hypothetical protein M8494_25835 [Serratia ureilytica]
MPPHWLRSMRSISASSKRMPIFLAYAGDDAVRLHVLVTTAALPITAPLPTPTPGSGWRYGRFHVVANGDVVLAPPVEERRVVFPQPIFRGAVGKVVLRDALVGRVVAGMMRA